MRKKEEIPEQKKASGALNHSGSNTSWETVNEHLAIVNLPIQKIAERLQFLAKKLMKIGTSSIFIEYMYNLIFMVLG